MRDDSVPSSADEALLPALQRSGVGVDRAPDQGGPESEPANLEFDGEDFLFHLYRGSELLQDNCVAEAKEELERALRMQPTDVEGQGLLGVVYFRLGLYPRAIRIYEELVRAFPKEITPLVNLALCYLKTGQHLRAREALEHVIEHVPDHRRAWGYLGLVFERAGELSKAQSAFERAGQHRMARRMVLRLEANSPTVEPVTKEMRRVAAAAVDELEDGVPFARAQSSDEPSPSSAGRWQTLELGRSEDSPLARRLLAADPPEPPSGGPGTALGPQVLVPARSPAELAQNLAVPLPLSGGRDSSTYRERLALLRVQGAMNVRLSSVRLLSARSGSFRLLPAYRQARGQRLEDPLGGPSPLGVLEGHGAVVLCARPNHRIVALSSEGSPFYVRESCLLGFSGDLRHEAGRLPRGDGGYHPIVQLTGQGCIVLECETELDAVPVSAEETGLILESDPVVGWTGRLLAQSAQPDEAPGGARGFIAFSGEGVVFTQLLH